MKIGVRTSHGFVITEKEVKPRTRLEAETGCRGLFQRVTTNPYVVKNFRKLFERLPGVLVGYILNGEEETILMSTQTTQPRTLTLTSEEEDLLRRAFADRVGAPARTFDIWLTRQVTNTFGLHPEVEVGTSMIGAVVPPISLVGQSGTPLVTYYGPVDVNRLYQYLKVAGKVNRPFEDWFLWALFSRVGESRQLDRKESMRSTLKVFILLVTIIILGAAMVAVFRRGPITKPSVRYVLPDPFEHIEGGISL